MSLLGFFCARALLAPPWEALGEEFIEGCVDVVGDLDVDDCATGSFCSSCAIPPRVAGGLWSDGVGCDACSYPFGVLCRGRG